MEFSLAYGIYFFNSASSISPQGKLVSLRAFAPTFLRTADFTAIFFSFASPANAKAPIVVTFFPTVTAVSFL